MGKSDWAERNQASAVSFRDEQIKAQLMERGDSAGSTARRDLKRYYTLMQYALRGISGKFSEKEILLMCDVQNGCWNEFRIHPTTALYANVADGIGLNQLDAKWEVDGAALLKKIKDLHIFEAATLLDAIERFWWEPTYQISDTTEKLKQVGLI